MTRKQFTQNLVEAFEFHDVDLPDEEVDKLVNYNFDESGEMAGWTFANFNSLAIDVAAEGLRRACKLNDLHYDSADEED